MARKTKLVNLNRCSGCWTCAMACKVINNLDDQEFWVTVRTLGNGAGIDKPAGQWPDLRMSWQPVFTKKCIDCGPRQAEGKEPFCVECCPNLAIKYGEEADAECAALAEQGFEIFSLPPYEGGCENVVYAKKELSRF